MKDKKAKVVWGKKYKKQYIKETEEMLNNTRLYAIIVSLLALKENVNLSKVKILNYILKNEGCSMNKISKDLKIDYKNLWRYMDMFEKRGIIEFGGEKIKGKKTQINFQKPIKKEL